MICCPARNPRNLLGKKTINACCLAPDFHPLLLDLSIYMLNKAYGDLGALDNFCTGAFPKTIFKDRSHGIDIIRC